MYFRLNVYRLAMSMLYSASFIKTLVFMFLHPLCPSWPSIYIYIYMRLIGRWVLTFFLSSLPSSHWHLDLKSAFLLTFVGRKKALFPFMSTKLWIIQPLYLNILSMFLIHSTLNVSVTSIYFITLSSDPSMSPVSATQTCNNLEYAISVQ